MQRPVRILQLSSLRLFLASLAHYEYKSVIADYTTQIEIVFFAYRWPDRRKTVGK
jgi:hypothetical protein